MSTKTFTAFSRSFLTGAALSGLSLFSATALAGTFKTINFGNGFADWTGVPVVATNTVPNQTPLDFTSLQMANDNTNVYYLVTMSGPAGFAANTAFELAIDSDNNPSTGFAPFGANIGSNVLGVFYSGGSYGGYTQTQTDYNSGNTFSSGGVPLNYGNGLIQYYPHSSGATKYEFSIPLNLQQTDTSPGGYSGPVFPGSSFGTMVYENGGSDSSLGPITYTLAAAPAVPEPPGLYLFGIGVLGLLLIKRRQAYRPAGGPV